MSRSHIAIQKALIHSIPGAKIEWHFREIGRVADVVYFPQKIIYEVQCSPISLQEVQSRNQDYSSIGFTVIWILHDHHFNKETPSPAELYLRQRFAYYSSITAFGKGFFYDQIEFFYGATRLYKSCPYLLKNLLPRPLKKLPFFFPKTLKNRSFCFLPGDAIDTLLTNNEGKKFYRLEKSFTQISFAQKWITPFFHYLLKKSSSSHKI